LAALVLVNQVVLVVQAEVQAEGALVQHFYLRATMVELIAVERRVGVEALVALAVMEVRLLVVTVVLALLLILLGALQLLLVKILVVHIILLAAEEADVKMIVAEVLEVLEV
jgi:hypothetical protein